IHALGASPKMFFTTLVHVFPPSSGPWTVATPVPTQRRLDSSGDGAIVRIVQWNSAAVLSTTIGPPDDCCLLLSFVVRSPPRTSQDWPWLADLNSTFPPK